jgi:hypothetical protein
MSEQPKSFPALAFVIGVAETAKLPPYSQKLRDRYAQQLEQARAELKEAEELLARSRCKVRAITTNESLRERLAALSSSDLELLDAFDTALDDAIAATKEACAQHRPAFHVGMSELDVCVCGYRFRGNSHFDKAADWQEHIRSLPGPDLSAASTALPAWQAWLDAKMTCGHVQRYRTGPVGMTDEQWVRAECDECLICERESGLAAASKREEELRAALAELEKDSHQYQTRPCPTCRKVSAALGRAFGCDAKSAAKAAQENVR